MVCNECSCESPKYRYKCCLRQFCSLNCYKVHACSSDNQETGLNSSQNVLNSDNFNTTDSVTKLTDRQLDILKSDSKLIEYLKNDQLKRVLVDVANSDDPMEKAHEYLKDDRFNEFVTHLLTLIENF